MATKLLRYDFSLQQRGVSVDFYNYKTFSAEGDNRFQLVIFSNLVSLQSWPLFFVQFDQIVDTASQSNLLEP